MAFRVLVVASLLLSAVFARQTLAFDSASVKPAQNLAAEPRGDWDQPGRITLTGVTVRMLIAQAYDFASLSDALNLLDGLPAWADSARFDVEAASAASPSLAQKRLMLRALLADRFHLATHNEMRDRPVFALRLLQPGRLGPQLHPHPPGAPCAPAPCGEVSGGMLPGTPSLAVASGAGFTLSRLAASIGGLDPFERPIVDQTGLSGTYDFSVQWRPGGDDPSVPGAESAAVIAALREQLGLKLDAATAPVAVLVVDHLDHPAAN